MNALQAVFSYFDQDHAKISQVMQATRAQWEIWLQVEMHLFMLNNGMTSVREVAVHGAQGPVDFEVTQPQTYGGGKCLIELKAQSQGSGNFSGTDAYAAVAGDINKLANAAGDSKISVVVGRHVPVELSRLPPGHPRQAITLPATGEWFATRGWVGSTSRFQQIWSMHDPSGPGGRQHRTNYYHATYGAMQVGVHEFIGTIPDDATQHYRNTTGHGWDPAAGHRTGGEHESLDADDRPATPR